MSAQKTKLLLYIIVNKDSESILVDQIMFLE